MTLLLAEILVKCPKQNTKVDARNVCEAQPRCQHFKHYSYIGSKVYVVCTYGEKEDKTNILHG